MRLPRDAWLPATVGVLAAVRFVVGLTGDGEAVAPAGAADRPPVASAPAGRPPGDAELALLGGLAEGDVLAGWTVERVEVAPDGALLVLVGNGRVRWTAEIRPAGGGPGPPPSSTGTFDLFYGNVGPEPATLDPTQAFAVLDALAARIARSREAP